MEIGKAYLIHCGDWHTFVGRVAEQTGPFTYKMASCSKLDTNQGDVWSDLCLEKNESMRRQCRYWHDHTPRLCVLSISALEWEGKTPQEAGYDG